MNTPISKKRKMNHSAAHKTRVTHEHAGAKPSKAEKRFEKKVLNVLKEPSATGKYTQVITVLLNQSVFNAYGIHTEDSGNASGLNREQLEFFTPRQFKDAEGVLFNGKTAAYNSFTTVTEGAGFNFPAQQTVRVNGASASFRFKNVSQHKTIVEMYICKGQDGGGSFPASDWVNSLNASGKYVIGGITTARTAIENTHVHMSNLEPFDSQWEVQKIVYKFEPGEEAFHLMKGPRGYQMNGSKKVKSTGTNASTGTVVWKSPNDQGCGCYVFFRVLNNLTLCTSTLGNLIAGNSIQICHPPHSFTNVNTAIMIGSVACEITRHYNIEAPEGVTVPLKNATVLNINYGNPSGTIYDIELDEDQPNDPPTAQPVP